MLLKSTGDQPEFLTVSGDKGIYASLYDLEPGRWTVSVKIPNEDRDAQEVLVVSKNCLSHTRSIAVRVAGLINQMYYGQMTNLKYYIIHSNIVEL